MNSNFTYNRLLMTLAIVLVGGFTWLSAAMVTFSVDMNEYPGMADYQAEGVTVNGTFNDWCGDCNPMSDMDGDGVYELTLDLPNDNFYEYKFVVGAWVDQEMLTEGSSCTLTTNGNTNRTLVVGDVDLVLDEVCYQTCNACGFVPSIQDVTFAVDMNDYAGSADYLTEGVTLNGTFNDWCGDCAQMDDSDADGVYTLTVSLEEGVYEFKYTIGPWTDQEMLSEGSECTVTNSGFTNRSLTVGTEPVVFPVNCFNACVACEDVVEVPAYQVTFKVDMNEYAGANDYQALGVNVNGTFNDWCGECWPLDDTDGDGVYEGTFPVDSGIVEFKYVIGDWTEGEEFVGGEACTNNPGGFWNRYMELSGDIVMDANCFNSCAACGAAVDCPSPDAIICDNIDSYEVGPMDGQGLHWDTWSGAIGGVDDGIVQDSIAFSNGQSVLIAEGQTQDVLLRLGDRQTGQWTVDWKMYVPDGATGYFNFQGEHDAGVSFITQVFFNADTLTPGMGAGTIDDVVGEFSYPQGEWFDVQNAIDLDANTLDITINGVLAGSLPYTSATGELLSAINFFSIDADNRYYLDDVVFDGAESEVVACPAPDAIICDNFDAYELGPIDVQAAHWGPWSAGGTVSNVSNQVSFSNGQSLKIDVGGVEDNLLLLGDETTGYWTVDFMAYVPTGATGFFNIQADPTPGNAFIYQAYFNQAGAEGGTGSFANMDAIFTYPENEWFPVSIIVDLNNVVHTLIVDETVVLESQPYVSNAGGGPVGDITLSGINFYSIDANNTLFIDDVVFDGDANVSVIEFTESAFTVYPNPTEDVITISGAESIDAVVVRDVLGAVVRQLDTPYASNLTVDMSGLTAGFYFVEVRVGDQVNVSRVVKK